MIRRQYWIRPDFGPGPLFGATQRAVCKLEDRETGCRAATNSSHPNTAGYQFWAVGPPPHVCEQLRRYRGFAISLTTKTLPTLLIPEDLPGAFNDPEAVIGWVDLIPPPRPRRRPAIRLPWPRTPDSAEASGLEADQAAE